MMNEIGYRYNALVHTKPCRIITRSIGDAEMLLSVMKTLSSRDLCMNTDPPARKCPFPWVTVRHNLPQNAVVGYCVSCQTRISYNRRKVGVEG